MFQESVTLFVFDIHRGPFAKDRKADGSAIEPIEPDCEGLTAEVMGVSDAALSSDPAKLAQRVAVRQAWLNWRRQRRLWAVLHMIRRKNPDRCGYRWLYRDKKDLG